MEQADANTRLTMNIHQIWIGDGISGRDAADVEAIRQKCVASGHTHRLWSYSELLETLEQDRVKDAFDVAQALLPHTMFASMVTDYFRLYLLREPGLYMDTDVICNADKFPEMPEGLDIQLCTNTNAVTPNTCILYAATELGAAGCAIGADMVAKKLEEELLSEDMQHVEELAAELKAKPFSLIGFIGPAFFRKTVVPVLEESGTKVGLFDLQFSSSSNPKSVLYHRGTGSWCYGGNGNHRRAGK